MENLIAHRLKVFRNSLGLTQAEFGDKCEISQRTYANLEGGKTKKVSAEYLNRIESAFKELSPKWLRQGVGEMVRPVPDVPKETKAPIMGIARDVGEKSPAEQIAYWKARAEIAEAELAAIEEAKRHEGAVRLIRSTGGRSFNPASPDAADDDYTPPFMVAETNLDYAPADEPRKLIGFGR